MPSSALRFRAGDVAEFCDLSFLCNENLGLGSQVRGFLEGVPPSELRVLVVPGESFAEQVSSGQQRTFCCPQDVLRYIRLVQLVASRMVDACMVGKRSKVGSRGLAHAYIWPFHDHAIRLASKLRSTCLFAEAIGDVCALVGVDAPEFAPSRWTLGRW